jgi:hypothetical protein
VNDIFDSVDQKICEKWHFTISEFPCECPQISCTVLYGIITGFAQDGFQKCSQVHIKCREWLQLWLFYGDTTKMAMNFSITS